MSLQGKLRGSVVDEQNLQRLVFAKARLEYIKLRKLFERHDKHDKNSEATFSEVCEHLADELVELDEAIKKQNYDNVREELADISNCADILAMMLDK